MKRIIYLLGLIMVLVSCDDVFEKDISKGFVNIIAPQDSVRVNAGDVRFLWNELEGASSYEIVIVSPSFPEAENVWNDEIIKEDSVTKLRNYTCELLPGTYQWRVAAKNSGHTSRYKVYSLFIEEIEE